MLDRNDASTFRIGFGIISAAVIMGLIVGLLAKYSG
jgi:hypothetical protein